MFKWLASWALRDADTSNKGDVDLVSTVSSVHAIINQPRWRKKRFRSRARSIPLVVGRCSIIHEPGGGQLLFRGLGWWETHSSQHGNKADSCKEHDVERSIWLIEFTTEVATFYRKPTDVERRLHATYHCHKLYTRSLWPQWNARNICAKELNVAGSIHNESQYQGSKF